MNIVGYMVDEAKKAFPKGFSRYAILLLLMEAPCLDVTEIRDKITTRFNVSRRIIDEQIYQMLGKLLRDGLIEEDENAKYEITAKGIEIAANIESINNILRAQSDLISRAQSMTKFIAGDLVDRIFGARSCVMNLRPKLSTKEQ